MWWIEFLMNRLNRGCIDDIGKYRLFEVIVLVRWDVNYCRKMCCGLIEMVNMRNGLKFLVLLGFKMLWFRVKRNYCLFYLFNLVFVLCMCECGSVYIWIKLNIV